MFYRYPSDELLKKHWLLNIGREDFVPNRGSVVCSQLFDLNDFVVVGGKRFLKPDSVPFTIKNVRFKYVYF